MGRITLREVDAVEITAVMDNFTDVLLPGSDLVKRFDALTREKVRGAPLAEHGLSLLIKARRNQEEQAVLLDAGWSAEGMRHNISIMEIDLRAVKAVVLSHGHMDHFGGLVKVLTMAGKKLPLICHPMAFGGPRFVLFPGDKKATLPLLNKEELLKAGAEVIKSKEPYVLEGSFFAATGEVPRVTEFEKGAPNMFIETKEGVRWDSVPDDQSLVTVVRNRGLVVVSGCAHAGIVNTVRWAQEITGVEKVYAVMGGFHLSGPHFESIVPPTVEYLKSLKPQVVVPMHCTGWQATHYFAREMPEAFVLNSVGATFLL